MIRTISFLVVASFGLAACDPGPIGTTYGPDGQTAGSVYRISDRDLSAIQLRVQDAVNTLRTNAGATELQLDAALNAAAATHSRDMSRQGRPWHFGSDGSSPIDRVRRAGYRGTMAGELVSETFETELETINAWMAESDSRAVLMDRAARDFGFAFHQDANGKLWWTMVLGSPGLQNQIAGGMFQDGFGGL